MLRLTIILFFFFFISCDRDKPEFHIAQDIIALHKTSSKASSDSIHWYLKKAADLIKASHLEVSDSIKAENDFLIGQYFIQQGKLDSANVYFLNATYFVKDKINTNREVQYFKKAWFVNVEMHKYGDALAISDRFKSLIDSNHHKKNTFLYYYNYFQQVTYFKLNDFKKALEYNQHTIHNALIAQDTLGAIAASITRYRSLYKIGWREESFKLLDSLLELKDKLRLEDKRLLYSDNGVFNFYEGNFKRAIEFYKQGVKITKIKPDYSKNKSEVANGYANIAEAYLELGEYASAKTYIDSAKVFGLNSIPEGTQRSLLKYQIRWAMGTNSNVQEVTNFFDSIFKRKDKLYKDRFHKELGALTKANENEKKLELEKHNSEIENLKLKTSLLLFLIALFLLIALIFIFNNRKKQQYEWKNLQIQQRLLRSQMNPHFTFNTLYSIQNKIEKNPKKGVTYLLKFSRLLRLILENSTHNYVLLEKELESLKEYLELQLVRFPSKFNYSINLENMEEDEFVFIPPMLLQPFIENSIEHGFNGIDYPGEIIVTLSMEKKFIKCIIEDNGQGIVQHKSSNKRSTSIGLISRFLLKATKSKIEFHNKKGQSENDSGLIVTFLIPYKLTEDD